jgi:hypothetical protein
MPRKLIMKVMMPYLGLGAGTERPLTRLILLQQPHANISSLEDYISWEGDTT